MFVQQSLPLTGRNFSQIVSVKLWTGSDLLLLFVDKTETSRSSGPVSQVFLPPLMSLVSFYRQTLHPFSPYSARATTCLVWCSCGLPFLRLKYNTVMIGLEKKLLFALEQHPPTHWWQHLMTKYWCDSKVRLWKGPHTLVWLGWNLFPRPLLLHSFYLGNPLLKS